MVIDLFGLEIAEVRARFPEVYQWVLDRVKPERDENGEAFIRNNWWLFGRPRPELRIPLDALPRFISTVETSKHRLFVFLDASILPDNMLVNFALADAFFLAVQSSKVHVIWALMAGGTLEDRPRYNKTRCFDPFPFPACSEDRKQSIRTLGERLDAHRKRQQQLHPDLTLTEMYNVLEKLRAGSRQPGSELTGPEQNIYQRGLIGLLREIHDELDAAVIRAYGWAETPAELTAETILSRLVQLNRERRAEEAGGLVRWLRPEYQAPQEAAQTLPGSTAEQTDEPTAERTRERWPSELPEQVRAIRQVLLAGGANDPRLVAQTFRAANRARVADILETLTALGQLPG